MTDRVSIASAWDDVLHEVRQCNHRLATSASILEVEQFQAVDLLLNRSIRPDADVIQWHSKFLMQDVITERYVKTAHDLNLEVHAWTVNEPEEMVRMIRVGVDGIITDYPTILLKLIGRLAP